MSVDIGETRLNFNRLLGGIDTMHKPKTKKSKTYQTLITEYEEEIKICKLAHTNSIISLED